MNSLKKLASIAGSRRAMINEALKRNSKRFLLLVLLWLIPALSALAGTPTVTYIYTDPQGTPLAETDAQGNVTATFDYRPYGSQALGTPPKGPGYTGHVNDPDTGLVYMQARYYDPGVGRFLSVDPVRPGSLFSFSRYAYANNNPIANQDPTGMIVGSDYTDPEGGDHWYASPAQPAHYCRFCFDTTGEIIDQKALSAATSGNHLETYGWAFAGVAWEWLGAESVSQVYDKGGASSGLDKAMAAVTIITLGKGAEIQGAEEAIRGGLAAVKLGREGEAAVRAAVDIGPKESFKIAGRTRIPDGMTESVLSEVKNVKALSYTQQLRDYAQYAASTGREFNLYVRPGAKLSAPLRAAESSGAINILEIPH
jgi:RHS repeat-associated protein